LIPTIAILTDFGTNDTYAGVMKAVILKIQPDAQIIDLTHAIPRGDIRAGAFELWRVAAYLPPGCIILGVVDPGVGTERQPIALDLGDVKAVGPDNGLFSYLLFEHQIQGVARLEAPEFRLLAASGTFHGRDIFAPAAAHLACGRELQDLGPSLSGIKKLAAPELSVHPDGSISGEIIHRDHFGNLVTSIGRLSEASGRIKLKDWTGGGVTHELGFGSSRVILADGTRLSLARTFSDVPVGQALAYTGSVGLLEIAVNQGDASQMLGLTIGDTVLLNDGEG
jgi:S-adenosylmethionine hydrolase